MKTCHGLLLAVIITSCTYLLVVYKSTSTNSQALQISGSHPSAHGTEHPTQSWRSSAVTLDGYHNIVDNQPLKLHCNSCSLVTSSGHLTGSEKGAEIDRADCVIRMNDAPTQGYQQHVGMRTSVRVVAHSSLDQLLHSRGDLLRADQDSAYIFWGPGSLMGQRGLAYRRLHGIKKAFPQLKVYTITQHKMQQLDTVFKKETGRDRKRSQSWLSTGWFTMILAIELCDRIDVYGMVSPDFCLYPSQPVPYHYYGASKITECTMYLSHEHGQRGGHHRFITEKQVFAKWAQTFDIHFHQPDWTPRTVQNSTSSSAIQGS